jgi:hypothetical protein
LIETGKSRELITHKAEIPCLSSTNRGYIPYIPRIIYL